jgi:hypothetical protein
MEERLELVAAVRASGLDPERELLDDDDFSTTTT